MQIALTSLTINSEYESLVPRVTSDEYQTMKASIQQHGIREPIVINMQNVVIDGHTRIQIAKELGLKEVPYRTESYASALEEQEAVIAYNLERRQLNLMQLGILGNKIEQLEKEKAKFRQLAELKQNKIKEESISNSTTKNEGESVVLNSTPRIPIEKTIPEPIKENGKSVEIAAKKVGISADTQKKVDKILSLSLSTQCFTSIV